MRAFVVSKGSTSIEQLRAVQLPDPPPPGPGQVSIRVRAAALNYRDQAVVSGRYFGGVAARDLIALSDGAGEITAVGAGVSRLTVGERVVATFNQVDPAGPPSGALAALGSPLDGMLAEQVVLYESGVLPVPKDYSFEQAATLPCAAVTAWNSLMVAGRPIRPGDTVLILGTGGVSMFALQFARAAGARVIVTSSSDAKLHRVKQLGAAYGINYQRTPDWDQEVLRLTGDRGVDAVVDTGGTGTLNRSFSALAQGGKVALVGVLTHGENNPYILMRKHASLHGIFVGDRAMFEAMAAAIDVNRIQPVIDRTFTLQETPDAYRYQLSGAFIGKVVITL